MCSWPRVLITRNSRVIAELGKVYQVALSLLAWGLTLDCLARLESEGRYALAPTHVFLQWVHSGVFVTALHEPHRFDDQVLSSFRKWAASVGLVLDIRCLRFLQLAPVRHSSMGFLAWCIRSFSKARSDYQDLPPPLSYEEMPHGIMC